MNYLAHAIPFFDRPYFAASSGVPDWLTVADRKVRLRTKHVEPFLHDADPILAQVAGGVLQHLRDDAQFHGTRAFFEVSGKIAASCQAFLDEHFDSRSDCGESERGDSWRVNFLGHVLCEVLLDAALAEEDRRRVADYYEILDMIDPATIESAVNRMAPRTTERLAFFIGEFRRAKILWDYLEDDKLMVRLNQVMRRVGLPALPDGFAAILPEARQTVVSRKNELLEGIPAGVVY
jgi:hypothetical protein